MAVKKSDLVAQWAFDTRPLLLRFHLWLEDVEVSWPWGGSEASYRHFDFVTGDMRRSLAMSAALTALGTRLFAPFGKGRELDKQGLNQVKKDADAISAYVMSESLWHFTRHLPENHAIMVCLGEGLMPKAGESPEMGANPLLGFGRVYARPQVARFLDARVHRLLNDPRYSWDDFYRKVRDMGITIWGAAVDTLENTSRFARGEERGPMAVLHVFDQPLVVARPYEAYTGTLAVPRRVVTTARDHAIHVDLLTPRSKLVEAIELAWPGIRREHVHVWTLGGPSRQKRLGVLWEEWRALGVHLVEDGWLCPNGVPAFVDSGTYAPTYLVGSWEDAAGETHVFLCDGYAASAEAVQAATLADALDVDVSMALYSPKFELPVEREYALMRLDAEDPELAARLAQVFGGGLSAEKVEFYRTCLRERETANLPRGVRTLEAADFFPEKDWRVVAAAGYMGEDPYTGLPGVTRVGENTYKVTSQLSAREARMRIDLTFRLLESFEQSRLVFSPLLERFYEGEDHRTRAVKVSDSGRIRNELQTLCSQALEYDDDERIHVHLKRVDDQVLRPEFKAKIREVLAWYKQHHPVWFDWLVPE